MIKTENQRVWFQRGIFEIIEEFYTWHNAVTVKTVEDHRTTKLYVRLPFSILAIPKFLVGTSIFPIKEEEIHKNILSESSRKLWQKYWRTRIDRTAIKLWFSGQKTKICTLQRIQKNKVKIWLIQSIIPHKWINNGWSRTKCIRNIAPKKSSWVKKPFILEIHSGNQG